MNPIVEKYSLSLNFMNENEFSGICHIFLKSEEENLILDAREMEIEKLLANGKEASYSYDERKRKIVLKEIRTGEVELEISYKRKYGEGLAGLYRAGKGDQSMITTQFESNDASTAFPCFDSPAIKAKFEVTLTISEDQDAISNMPQISNRKISEGSKEIKFDTTPPMSTYLLYIGVGKFLTKTRNHGKCEIILARPGKDMRSDDFPLEVADKCITFYEDYFGIPYALPKMHLIAVPDFAAGAMENWGAITFREDVLLNNENTDSEGKILIAIVIAHEIAHQWFGNLVTMKWWNDLWLNESFATFMSSLCVNSLFPEYEEEKTYYLNETVGSMASDALLSSHPINVEVKEPEDIEQVFDDISYGKGGSILRMIHHYMGEEKFRSGLSSYLEKFRYGNAEGNDLWTELEKSSELNISSIMNNWINQSGFPLINVDYDGKNLKLEQHQFLLSGEKSEKIWKIPVFIQTENEEIKILMENRTFELEVKGFQKLNSRGTGYYQTIYNDLMLDSLKERMKKMDPMDKAEIVGDSYFQLISGRMSAEKFFASANEVATSFSTPSSLLLVNNLDRLNGILYDKNEFSRSSAKIIKKIIESGESKGSKMTILDQITIKKAKVAYAKVNHEFAMTESEKFNSYFNLKPDDRELVALSKAIVANDLGEMIAKLEEAEDDSDRETLIVAMGWANGKKNHKKIIKLLIQGKIKKQDAPSAVFTLIRNPDSRKYVASILLPLLRNMSKAFGNTGMLSTAAFMTIPLLGLENEAKVRKVMSKLNYNEIRMGYEKGLEMLEVYKKMRASIT
ncbi:MAG: hypothetical protein B2I18_00805 [Cuniculiplasma sp. C_DKE]|jgi:tricorn protease interacting factor F2/3|nr:MAG: hypothetical protein AMDU5_GPLC00007G0152 [Thermoplasmatales archaeon Gpl]OWP55713.1 MAG: hypothetical protein B2I18_00805 [Cuniculiplasma sp. C_DKE]